MTADDVWQYVEQHRRIHGSLPKLRDCVERFDGKLLNVLMCIGELSADRKLAIRAMGEQDRAAKRGRGLRREN